MLQAFAPVLHICWSRIRYTLKHLTRQPWSASKLPNPEGQLFGKLTQAYITSLPKSLCFWIWELCGSVIMVRYCLQ